MQAVDLSLLENRKALSEYESKQILARYGIPVTSEVLVRQEKDLGPAIRKVGYPMVLKGCSPDISHKTEKDLVRVDIRTEDEAMQAFKSIFAQIAGPDAGVLVQEMVKGKRELMAGMTRDPQFGPCVMFGLGGIFTEALKDVCFRMAPLNLHDALEMMKDIKGHEILGPLRAMPPVNKDELAQILMAIGRIGVENEHIKEIDINPLIICEGHPVAVDALVVLV
ncbi:MAG: acetate--CoA ligase family protein [Desulfomonile tiedjei]|uniref:Acetate--CoA ligase family protein n=1 Tax=Desulfomonile tiedjei TaxID=2358 RepID=A0A9D6V9R4_9BACT|nr:acetate--CoA ligase family protein [Desulfomonile tiedjei]